MTVVCDDGAVRRWCCAATGACRRWCAMTVPQAGECATVAIYDNGGVRQRGTRVITLRYDDVGVRWRWFIMTGLRRRWYATTMTAIVMYPNGGERRRVYGNVCGSTVVRRWLFSMTVVYDDGYDDA